MHESFDGTVIYNEGINTSISKISRSWESFEWSHELICRTYMLGGQSGHVYMPHNTHNTLILINNVEKWRLMRKNERIRKYSPPFLSKRCYLYKEKFFQSFIHIHISRSLSALIFKRVKKKKILKNWGGQWRSKPTCESLVKKKKRKFFFNSFF